MTLQHSLCQELVHLLSMEGKERPYLLCNHPYFSSSLSVTSQGVCTHSLLKRTQRSAQVRELSLDFTSVIDEFRVAGVGSLCRAGVRLSDTFDTCLSFSVRQREDCRCC